MTIPSSRSLIFEVKSTGSELAFGRLRQTSDIFGRLRTSSGILGNDRVVFKNPSTPRIKISRLYLRKSWQVYDHQVSLHFNCVKDLLYSVFVYNFTPTIISASCCLLEKQQRTTLHTTHIQNWTTRIYYVTYKFNFFHT